VEEEIGKFNVYLITRHSKGAGIVRVDSREQKFKQSIEVVAAKI
jgi:hypothetical protein